MTGNERTGESTASKDGRSRKAIRGDVLVHNVNVGDRTNGGECAEGEAESDESREG